MRLLSNYFDHLFRVYTSVRDAAGQCDCRIKVGAIDAADQAQFGLNPALSVGDSNNSTRSRS